MAKSRQLIVLVAILLGCSTALSECIIYRSQNGKLYCVRDTVEGPEFVEARVVDLGDPDNPNPTPTPNDPTDKWGLVKVSREALSTVPDYPNKEDHTQRLAAYYQGTAQAVRAGSIPQTQLTTVVEQVHKLALQEDANKWDFWRDKTKTAFSQAPIESKEDAAKGLEDISKGLEPTQSQNVTFQELLKFFIEVILPIILKMIGGGA